MWHGPPILALILALKPTLVLLSELHDLSNRTGKGVDILTQAQQHLEFVQHLVQLEQYGRLLAPGIGPHRQLQEPPGSVPQVCPACNLW